ncbi:MAG: hypothetical protein ABIR26_17980 [Ramlibacter sp.]
MQQFAKAHGTGQDTQIVLGDGWKQFAFTTDGFEYLGTIRRGMEIGALARDESGGYWQVNGDIRRVLNTSRVTALLRAAGGRRKQSDPWEQPKAADRANVVVVIKPRRRIVVPPT